MQLRSIVSIDVELARGPDRIVETAARGAHEWVEALHSGSELTSYDTFYIATNTSYLGVLVHTIGA
jgi:hypothetical protein